MNAQLMQEHNILICAQQISNKSAFLGILMNSNISAVNFQQTCCESSYNVHNYKLHMLWLCCCCCEATPVSACQHRPRVSLRCATEQPRSNTRTCSEPHTSTSTSTNTATASATTSHLMDSYTRAWAWSLQVVGGAGSCILCLFLINIHCNSIDNFEVIDMIRNVGMQMLSVQLPRYFC